MIKNSANEILIKNEKIESLLDFIIENKLQDMPHRFIYFSNVTIETFYSKNKKNNIDILNEIFNEETDEYQITFDNSNVNVDYLPNGIISYTFINGTKGKFKATEDNNVIAGIFISNYENYKNDIEFDLSGNSDIQLLFNNCKSVELSDNFHNTLKTFSLSITDKCDNVYIENIEWGEDKEIKFSNLKTLTFIDNKLQHVEYLQINNVETLNFKTPKLKIDFNIFKIGFGQLFPNSVLLKWEQNAGYIINIQYIQNFIVKHIEKLEIVGWYGKKIKNIKIGKVKYILFPPDNQNYEGVNPVIIDKKMIHFIFKDKINPNYWETLQSSFVKIKIVRSILNQLFEGATELVIDHSLHLVDDNLMPIKVIDNLPNVKTLAIRLYSPLETIILDNPNIRTISISKDKHTLEEPKIKEIIVKNYPSLILSFQIGLFNWLVETLTISATNEVETFELIQIGSREIEFFGLTTELNFDDVNITKALNISNYYMPFKQLNKFLPKKNSSFEIQWFGKENLFENPTFLNMIKEEIQDLKFLKEFFSKISNIDKLKTHFKLLDKIFKLSRNKTCYKTLDKNIKILSLIIKNLIIGK